jgi:hypothetical protein
MTEKPKANANQPVASPVTFKSYPASGLTQFTDKTGTIYQSQQGDNNKTAPWGQRVWRIKPGGKPEELFCIVGGHGDLVIDYKTLIFEYCDANWKQWTWVVPGYISPSDSPSSKVVNVDEAAMAVYKQQVALAQKTANQASYDATQALGTSTDLKKQMAAMQSQIAAMQNQIKTMQSQILSQQQIEDIVWSKIWDVNYMIRMGFLQGSSTIQQVQDYLNDLAVYIKKVVSK